MSETESRVRDVLSYISPNCDREKWWKIAAGVMAALGPDGLPVFLEWSEPGCSYDEASATSTYKSFAAQGGISFGTVVEFAKPGGYDPKKDYVPPTAAEKAAIDEKAKADAIAFAIKRAGAQADTKRKSEKRWDDAKERPATAAYPYLKKKGIQPHGARLGPWWKLIKAPKDTPKDAKPEFLKLDDVLLIPLRDRGGVMHGLQAITAEGEKLHQSGAAKVGHFFSMPGPVATTVVLCEGFATGASINEATGFTVLVCFDEGNIIHVARDIVEQAEANAEIKPANVIIAADNDTKTEAEGKGNPGMRAAFNVGLQFGMRVAVPPPGDFNDLALAEGREAVQKAFEAASVPTKPFVMPAGPADALVAAVVAPLGGELNSVKRPVHDVHQMDRVNEMSWPHMDLKPGGTKPLNTIPNLKHLLNNYHFTVRYDVIRKELTANHPGQRGTPDNVRSKVIDTVLSLAALNHLPRSDVPSFLLSIGDDHQVNPVIDFITAKEWDGISRFDELLASIKTKPGFDRELLTLLVRRWLTSAVAAAATSKGFWSKGVLVFQGDQSLGKTAWFRALLPMAMRDLVKVDAHIDPANKDTIISAVSHWLVELGELDGTLRKTDIARLKGFISQDVDQFRRPYGRAEEKFQRRTVFFASVNPEQFLADETGNVRWWTVPVSSINASHNIDMQQLWAEVFTWFKAGERWWLDSNEEARLNSANADHEQGSPVDELITCRYDFAGVTRRPLTATQVLLELGYDNPNKKTLNESANVMRKHFGDSTKSNSRRVFRVPCLIARY
jgi:putative DNA primase/helicase